MTWEPFSLSELERLISADLAECSEAQREYFAKVKIQPAKWQLSPWGDEGGGFWAIAIHDNRVLWWNDIEEGFNVSSFEVPGQIPPIEYWCNQDPLKGALHQLASGAGWHWGPPRPISEGE